MIRPRYFWDSPLQNAFIYIEEWSENKKQYKDWITVYKQMMQLPFLYSKKNILPIHIEDESIMQLSWLSKYSKSYITALVV